MYARTVRDGDTPQDGGVVLDFGVSGNLWHGVLVMYDRASGSLWTQLDGRAIEGPHRGRRLEHVHSTFTTWAQWKAEHPDTEVLEKPADERGQTASAYADYLADPERLFRPHLGEGLGGVRPKDVVFGVRVGAEATAVSAALLFERRVVNLVVGGRPVALLADPVSGKARGVSRLVEGRVLLLGPAGDAPAVERVTDTRSGRSIDPGTLEPLRIDRAFWYAWARSHPESVVLAN